jgi:uncharacterized damage-inducible protein DinB
VTASAPFITPDAMLAHWQGHRRLTRRVLDTIGAPIETISSASAPNTAPLHDLILYVIDNEIHHRGQGYVHLRALGIEPPPFYDRS